MDKIYNFCNYAYGIELDIKAKSQKIAEEEFLEMFNVQEVEENEC